MFLLWAFTHPVTPRTGHLMGEISSCRIKTKKIPSETSYLSWVEFLEKCPKGGWVLVFFPRSSQISLDYIGLLHVHEESDWSQLSNYEKFENSLLVGFWCWNLILLVITTSRRVGYTRFFLCSSLKLPPLSWFCKSLWGGCPPPLRNRFRSSPQRGSRSTVTPQTALYWNIKLIETNIRQGPSGVDPEGKRNLLSQKTWPRWHLLASEGSMRGPCAGVAC